MAVSQETEALEWRLRGLLRQNEKRLVFDLTDVDDVDADAAVFLVRCYFIARGSGCELRFAGASAHVLRPFRATMLDSLLSFDSTVTAAVEHYTQRSRLEETDSDA